MSSFAKKGMRAESRYLAYKTKQHVKAFYKIMDDMERISKQLSPDIEYTEENINEYVKPIYRELDNMEKFVLLGKLHYNEREEKDKY